jgi:3-oxoacyl-[acyl-carrier protein] reductase
MQTYHDLVDKVAIVTGSSSGIGSAAAKTLAASGAKVVVNYSKNAQGAADTVASIKAAGGHAIAVQADVRSEAGCAALVAAAVQAFGPVDILVNNAGSLVKRTKILDLSPDVWDGVMDLNIKSVYLMTRAVAASMMQRRSGAIINLTSIAAHNGGGPGAGHYAAAKAAVFAFTKNMAKEFAPLGVRVNGVSPGVIDTPFHEEFSTPEMMKAFVASIPLGRVGKSEEAAQVIAFLSSSASSYVCGETIEINGGQFMR